MQRAGRVALQPSAEGAGEPAHAAGLLGWIWRRPRGGRRLQAFFATIYYTGPRDGGGTVYLPYDFSDQCTAWLRVSSSDGQTAEVQAGWSLIEGWGIYPSDYLSPARVVADFDPISGAQVVCSLIDLAARIDANRTTLEATGP
ncbi:hypothetical protein [Streptomyces sp. NPDC056707]|uniref:hypothetical protein n=1 Tax=Streptomyces sp. NPDC056707 TaxID=3345919 RepID=UPI00368B58AA